MAYKKEPYLTKEDRERIARIEHDPKNDYFKFKYLITLGKKGLDQKVCIIVYGSSESEVKKNIKEHLENFKKNDSSWRILKTEDIKKKEKEEIEE